MCVLTLSYVLQEILLDYSTVVGPVSGLKFLFVSLHFCWTLFGAAFQIVFCHCTHLLVLRHVKHGSDGHGALPFVMNYFTLFALQTES